MKARPFFTSLAAVLLALLALTFGLLWGMDQRSPLRLGSQPLHLPRSAQFVPRDADLTLHWLADPTRLPAFAQAVASPSNRRDAREGARHWRAGAFALAGLDFDDELAGWLGSELSLTLIDASTDHPAPGWVLGMTSRSPNGARRFLQRFWQTRSFAGTDLQVRDYRGVGVISGKGALLGRDPQSLATALIDDDLLLLASGRGVLEAALDISQLPDQHQGGDQQLQRLMDRFGEGVALLTASPRALNHWLGLPASVVDRNDLAGMVASFRPEGAELNVDAVLRFQERIDSAQWPALEDLTLHAGGRASALALLQNPARLLDPAELHPLAQWFGPALRSALASRQAVQAILSRDDGPLLWTEQEDGWLLASRPGQPEPAAVNDQLASEGLVRSELSDDDDVLQVWTLLERQRGRGDGLQARLAVANVLDAGRNWWGETITVLKQRSNGRALKPRLRQWERLQSRHDPSQAVMLAAEPAQQLIGVWRPWTLLQALGGQPLQPRIQGLVLAAERDEQMGEESLLPVHARLEFG